MSAKKNKKVVPHVPTAEELAKEEARAQKRREIMAKAKAENATKKEKEQAAADKASAKERARIEKENRENKAKEAKRVASSKKAYNKTSYKLEQLEAQKQADLKRAEHTKRNTAKGITPEGEVAKVEERYAKKEAALRAKEEKSGKGGKGGKSTAESKAFAQDRRHNITLICLLVAILIFCVWMFLPLDKKITQGLDIQGGLSVTMTATSTDGSTPSSDDMDLAVTIIQTRVNNLGASEATVQKQGDSNILVQIPGLDDKDTALDTIGSVGVLEFVDLNDITDETVAENINNGQTGMELEEGTYTAFMTGDSISSSSVDKESEVSSDYAVDLVLDEEGTEAFSKVTSELVSTNGKIAIVLDGIVQSAPAVQSAITNGRVAITGGYDMEQAKALKNILDSGSLPVQLSYSEANVVGPTLGQESLNAGLIAALIGMALVAIYLLIFYRGLGALTAASIATFAIFYLGILAVLSHFGAFALTLPGLAGVVLTIGMAADSSVLVLERFREEIREGKSVRAASITGVRHGILTSIDADAVTLISALALFFIAVGSVKGFGLTMAIGILCDILGMLIFKGPAIRLLAPGQIARHPGFWGIKGDIKRGLDYSEKNGLNSGSTRKNAEILTLEESRAERRRIKQELRKREAAEAEARLRSEASQADKKQRSGKKGGR